MAPNLPTEAYIQQACLDDCTTKYATYHEWWENHSSGVSSRIRKLIVEEYLGYQISWEFYDEYIGG